MGLCDILVGDDGAGGLRRQSSDSRAGLADHAVADHDVIGPRTELDRHDFRRLADGRRCKMIFQRAHHILDDGVEMGVARLHRHVGLRIDRVTLVHQPAKRAFRIGILQ